MFRRKVPIEDHVADWMFETYAWLLREFGGMQELRLTRLVLPTSEYFPVDDVDEADLASELFLRVKEHARMLDWPCRLVEAERGRDPHDAMAHVPHSFQRSGAAGTFTHNGRIATIAYDPDLVAEPTQLVATFAHELGHYLLAGARTTPPGGREAEEPATDVAAVFMGFGIFLANSAFTFQQYSDGLMAGWRTSRRGYLGEADLAYALAIFAELLDVADREIKPHLKANPRGYLAQSRKHLRRARLEQLLELKRL